MMKRRVQKRKWLKRNTALSLALALVMTLNGNVFAADVDADLLFSSESDSEDLMNGDVSNEPGETSDDSGEVNEALNDESGDEVLTSEAVNLLEASANEEGILYSESFEEGISGWIQWRNSTSDALVIEEGVGQNNSKCVFFSCDSVARGSIAKKFDVAGVTELYIDQLINCDIIAGTLQVKYTYYDNNGTAISDTEIVTLASGSCDWRHKNYRITVPVNAQTVKLEYVYSSAIGTIKIDDITVWDGLYVEREELEEGLFYKENFNQGISDWTQWRSDTSEELKIQTGTGPDNSLCTLFYSENECRGNISNTIAISDVSELYIKQSISCSITAGTLQVRYTFYNNSGTTIEEAKLITLAQSSCDWQTKTFRIAVPDNATSVKLEYIHSSAIGTIQVDDIEIWNSAYIQETELPEGMIYKDDFNNGISDWRQWRSDTSTSLEIVEGIGNDNSSCLQFSGNEVNRGYVSKTIGLNGVKQLYVSQLIYADITTGNIQSRYTFYDASGNVLEENETRTLAYKSCDWRTVNVNISVPDNAASMDFQYVYSFAIGTACVDDLVIWDSSYVEVNHEPSEYAVSFANTIHPRIALSQARITELKNAINTDSQLNEKYQQVVRSLERELSTSPVAYDVSSGILDTSGADMVAKYAFGYKLTDDSRYAERAMTELLNLCGYPDWAAEENYVQTAKMLYGIALGYDWLYDYMSESQRVQVREAIQEKALVTAADAYNNHNYFTVMNNNYNIVSNTAVVLAASSILDADNVNDYAWLIDCAAECILDMLPSYLQDGGCTEGVTYWTLVMKGVSLAEYILPQLGYQINLNYDVMGQYLFATADPMFQSFNYADADLDVIPGYYGDWLANKTGNGLYKLYDNMVYEAVPSGEIYDFLYYSSLDTPSVSSIPENLSFAQTGIFVMRSDYLDPNATYLGIKGGVSVVESHEDRDIGSFIFTMDGVRWFEDMGKGSYFAEGYFDNSENGGRWNYLCKNAHGHNTITIAGKDQMNVYSSIPCDITDDSIALDLTSAYDKSVVNSLMRTFTKDNDRAFTIYDAYSLAQSEDITWHYYTSASVEIVDNQVFLSKDGKKITMQFSCDDAVSVSADSVSGYDDMTVINVKTDGNNGTMQTTIKSCDENTVRILAQPKDVTIDGGTKAMFSVTAAGDGLSYQWQYSKNWGDSWLTSGAPGNKTNSISFAVSELQSGYWYRCIVKDIYGNEVISDPAVLVTGDKLTITAQPTDITSKVGNQVSFNVAVAGNAEKYQWQYSKDYGKNWLISTAPGSTSASIKFTASELHLGYKYRCIISNEEEELTSAEATLYLEDLFKIVEQPSDITCDTGEKVIFAVNTIGQDLSYQWQYSKDWGKNWLVSGAPGNKTKSISFTAAESQSGYKYRCIVTDTNGKQESSDEVVLIVGNNIIIEEQPMDLEKEVGESAIFNVVAVGRNLNYQWEYSKDLGNNWLTSNATGNKTSSIKVTVSGSNSGYQYRCIITNTDGTKIISDAATLLVKNQLTILSQPSDMTCNPGEKAKFAVKAVGGELTYQWQYSKDCGETWLKSGAPGSTTSSIVFTSGEIQNGYQYRCIIRDGNGNELVSNAATLLAGTKLVLLSHPKDVASVAGERVSFTVKAVGDGLSYQWQFSVDGGEHWVNSGGTGNKTATLHFSTIESQTGNMYRCILNDSAGNSDVSDPALLVVGDTGKIIMQPKSVEYETSQKVTFAIRTVGNIIKFQWQYSKDGGITWLNSGASGNKTNTISFTALEEQTGYLYRCIVVDSKENRFVSDIATLVIGDKMAISIQPKDVTVLAGERVNIKITVVGNVKGYQWQYSKDGGKNWFNSSAGSSNTSLLSFTAASTHSNYLYRCILTDNNGAQVVSNSVALTVK